MQQNTPPVHEQVHSVLSQGVSALGAIVGGTAGHISNLATGLVGGVPAAAQQAFVETTAGPIQGHKTHVKAHTPPLAKHESTYSSSSRSSNSSWSSSLDSAAMSAYAADTRAERKALVRQLNKVKQEAKTASIKGELEKFKKKHDDPPDTLSSTGARSIHADVLDILNKRFPPKTEPVDTPQAKDQTPGTVHNLPAHGHGPNANHAPGHHPSTGQPPAAVAVTQPVVPPNYIVVPLHVMAQAPATAGYAQTNLNVVAAASQIDINPYLQLGATPGDIASILTKQLNGVQNGTESEQRIQLLKNLQNSVTSITWNLRKDLCQWTTYWSCCCGGRCLAEDIVSSRLTYLMMFLAVGLYAAGLSFCMIHLQALAMCDQNLMQGKTPTVELRKTNQDGTPMLGLMAPPLGLCSGWAEKCTIQGTTLNFKQYVQYRTASYFLLLIPFLYIPFMIVNSMNQSVADVMQMLRDTLAIDDIATRIEKGVELENKIKEAKQQPINLQDAKSVELGTIINSMYSRLDKDGHNGIVMLLFFLFHFVMGIASLFLDGCVTVTFHVNDESCQGYEARMKALPLGTSMTMEIKFLSMWQLFMGSFFMFITIMYLFGECRARCVRQNYAAADTQYTRWKNKEIKMERNRLHDIKHTELVENLARQVQSAQQSAAAALALQQQQRQQQQQNGDDWGWGNGG